MSGSTCGCWWTAGRRFPIGPPALLGTGPSPVPMLQESARLLEAWGADLIAIPCNTAHGFLPDVQEAVDIEVLDMIGVVGREMAAACPEGAPIGLLSTTAAQKLENLPRPDSTASSWSFRSPAIQEDLVAGAILQVKLEDTVEEPRRKLLEVIETLDPAPEAVIAGCTEVELAFKELKGPCPFSGPWISWPRRSSTRAWREA